MEATRDFAFMFPYWQTIRELVASVRGQVAQGLVSFEFTDIVQILQRTSEGLGVRLDESNCQEMKGHLIRAEEHNGTGRVKLRDFYTSVVSGNAWQFQESIDYLRQIGVLDESDASQPRVIIANYLYMHSDCVVASDFYNLCCLNPCEGLMGQLEQRIRAPHATPAEIVSIVSALQSSDSSTFPNGTLLPALVRKLEDVAEHHGGVVPLHGRLFAQWMHFVHPHECPYPHLASATKLLTGNEWLDETGMESWWSDSQMKEYIESSHVANAPSEIVGCDLQDPELAACPIASMWLHEEELLDSASWHATRTAEGPAPQLASRRSSPRLRTCMLVAVLLSFIASMRNLVMDKLSLLGVKQGKVGILSV